MDLQNLHVVPLHKHPEYLRECCDLINEEWPRSETARMLSLKASCDELPTSLILINDKNHLLGHCKLTRIPSIPESCFVETVVISKSRRGQGLGSFLMKYIEEYCKKELGQEMIHLSTKGQENFYAKLGYTVCSPVSIYGVSVPSNNYKSTQVETFTRSVHTATSTESPLAPPPPPPPMPTANVASSNNSIKSSKTFMCKYLK